MACYFTIKSKIKCRGKIIMLHGWAQNGKVFSYKSKTLTRKLNQAGYDCIFIDAPFQLPITSLVEVEPGVNVEVENGKRENARAWFYYSESDIADASLALKEVETCYYGLDESIQVVENVIRKEVKNNLDDTTSVCGILGFSQGAVFAHILSLLAWKKQGIFPSIKCAILISGFSSMHSNMESIYNLSLPSLHVIGQNDKSVLASYSEKLVKCFDRNAQVLYHDKGHIIPQKSAECAQIISFLNKITL